MLRGLLTRTFEVSVGGMRLSVKAQRFCSMADVETAYLRYAVDVLDGSGTLDMELALDGDVTNEDANWDERFWDIDSAGGDGEGGHLTTTTRKTGFTVSHAMRTSAWLDSQSATGLGQDQEGGHSARSHMRSQAIMWSCNAALHPSAAAASTFCSARS